MTPATAAKESKVVITGHALARMKTYDPTTCNARALPLLQRES